MSGKNEPEMMKNRTILVIPKPVSDIRNLVDRYHVKSPFHWIYLGKDYTGLVRAEREIGTAGTRISTGDRLQRAAKEYRQDYIDFIGSLVPGHDTLRWWASSVSEKNPFASDIFLYFCYVRLALDVVSSCEEDLVLLCENRILGEAVAEHCPDHAGQRIVVAGSEFNWAKQILARALKGIAGKCWFMARYGSRIVTARIFRFVQNIRGKRLRPEYSGSVLLHSWTDNRSFTNTGKFENIYFRDLAVRLTEQKKPPVYLADVLPTMSYLAAIRNFFRNGNNVCLLEEFLAPADIFRAILYLNPPPSIDPVHCSLKGIRMNRFIHEEFAREKLSTRREESYLRYLSIRFVSDRLHPAAFTYLFENHVWEKLLIAGFRKYSPSTFLAGYVHTIVREMYTTYSVSESELGAIPLPHTIVVSGEHARNALIRSGFSSGLIRIGGALRYPDILRTAGLPDRRQRPTRKNVLIALSAGLDESLELAMKALCALQELDVDILIKCHPVLPCTKILPGLRKLNCNVIVSEDPVDRLLMQADLLLYSETTVCIEALALGIPVVHVRSDCRIDMNILENLPSVRSELEINGIREAVVAGLSGPDHAPATLERSFISTLFSPVQADIVDIFTAN